METQDVHYFPVVMSPSAYCCGLLVLADITWGGVMEHS